MNSDTKTYAVAGLAATITGVMLIGTTGLALVAGWALWAVGLAVLLATIPSARDERRGSAVVTSLPTAALHDRQAA